MALIMAIISAITGKYLWPDMAFIIAILAIIMAILMAILAIIIAINAIIRDYSWPLMAMIRATMTIIMAINLTSNGNNKCHTGKYLWPDMAIYNCHILP